MSNGPGHLNGITVAPAEVDTPFATGQSIWWWAANQTFKSLRELQIEYDNSVGHNANLLLGITPDFSGRLPDAHVQRYTEFGDWTRSCYGVSNMLIQREGVLVSGGDSLVLPLPARARFDRLWLMEDLRQGQKINGFTIELQDSRTGSWSLQRPWLFPCSVVGVCGAGGGGPQGGGDSPWLPTVRKVAVFSESCLSLHACCLHMLPLYVCASFYLGVLTACVRVACWHLACRRYIGWAQENHQTFIQCHTRGALPTTKRASSSDQPDRSAASEAALGGCVWLHKLRMNWRTGAANWLAKVRAALPSWYCNVHCIVNETRRLYH